MNDELFILSRLNESESLIEKIAERVIIKIKHQIPQTTPNQQSKFGDLNWFISIHPKNPAKSTVYCNICSGKIPAVLIHKAEGTKNVLFFKERVLDWINRGFPKEYQPKATE